MLDISIELNWSTNNMKKLLILILVLLSNNAFALYGEVPYNFGVGDLIESDKINTNNRTISLYLDALWNKTEVISYNVAEVRVSADYIDALWNKTEVISYNVAEVRVSADYIDEILASVNAIDSEISSIYPIIETVSENVYDITKVKTNIETVSENVYDITKVKTKYLYITAFDAAGVTAENVDLSRGLRILASITLFPIRLPNDAVITSVSVDCAIWAGVEMFAIISYSTLYSSDGSNMVSDPFFYGSAVGTVEGVGGRVQFSVPVKEYLESSRTIDNYNNIYSFGVATSTGGPCFFRRAIIEYTTSEP